MSSSNKQEKSVVRFDDWVQSREIMCWGTNAGASSIAFQGWRHFKEAFAPELIHRAIIESPIPVRSCLDPFGGSGTTALACQFLGVLPKTIEVNPYLADLIEAKLCQYNTLRLSEDFGLLVKRSYEITPDVESLRKDAPSTFYEPGNDGRWIFNYKVAERLSCLLQAISSLTNQSHVRLFRALLGGVLVDASNVVINGKGRRYRNGWQGRVLPNNVLDNSFHLAVKRAVGDIARYGDRACNAYELQRGDSRDLVFNVDSIDLCVFSPPYPNSFDYTDVYNVELWAMGYLLGKESNRQLRSKTLTSHVQLHRNYEKKPSGSIILDECLKGLDVCRSVLWNKNIPEMIGAYFSDMLKVINGVHLSLSNNGTMWLVVGDSKYAGVIVRTAKILEQLLEPLGWTLVKSEAFRSMRVSAQQGGQYGLDETLIVFQKVTPQ